MLFEMPKVSVVIPTYNLCDLLRSTIDSVLAQTLGDWELIIVDDGSTDGTHDVVQSIENTCFEQEAMRTGIRR